jgi:7-cyano-7-deazaguanine synthase
MTENSVKKAVVLLSGGLDSYTCAGIAKSMGFELYALSVNYGQRHKQELTSAENIVLQLNMKAHTVLEVDLRNFGGSALTSNEIDVPKTGVAPGIPVTYVPGRNTILLSLAMAWSEALGAFDIFHGANCLDYSGYPDCRPEFIEAFEKLANLATAAGVEGKGQFHVHTPLLHLTKAEIIKKGMELGLDYSITHSCYDPDEQGRACGKCDSCLLRAKGFTEAGFADPTVYQG